MATPARPTQVDPELRRLDRRFEVWRILAYGSVVALCIAATALPLFVLRDAVKPLAGKTTKVYVNVALGVTLSLSLVLNGVQFFKGTLRKGEIKRERERARQLEARLGLPEVTDGL